MKKLLVALLGIMLVLSGCSGSSSKTYKVGVASITTVEGKAPVAATADKKASDGQVQANTTYAIVLLDKDSKIVDVMIDTAQNTVKFDAAGKLIGFDKSAATPTKKEKGAAYGMSGSSSIKKDWFEQIAALETAMKGKTLDQIAALKSADGDLKTSVTISIETYQAVVKKAAEAAVEVKDVKTIGSASNTVVAATDASADKLGSIQFDTTFTGTATDKDGKILFVYNDVAQNKATVSIEGAPVITSADPVNFSTKKELKEKYGMKDAGTIKKEWYEQQAELEKYMVGKTVAEVKAIPVDDTTVTTNADLKTKVTIKIGTYIAAVEKANSTGYTRTIE